MPFLIYEFPHQGRLAEKIKRQKPEHESILQEPSLPWTSRVKICYDISYALAYLQNGFRRPVIFRNFSARDVYFDKDGVAKLTGFHYSALIPEGQVHVDDAVIGTTGFMAPEYSRYGRLTDKTDVYMFGKLMFELIAGTPGSYGHSLFRLLSIARHTDVEVDLITDPAILKEVQEKGHQQQLQEVFDLSKKCTADQENDRPNMVDVASKLKKITELYH